MRVKNNSPNTLAYNNGLMLSFGCIIMTKSTSNGYFWPKTKVTQFNEK